MALQVGDFTEAKGFITRLISVIGQPADELERRLGFRRDRLVRGWMLLLLKEPIAPGEFAFAGYTNTAGGKTNVALPSGVVLSVGIDEQMRARCTALDEQLGTGWYRLQRDLADSFVLSGSARIVKVVPHMPHIVAMPDDEQYPSGTGVPQWILSVQKRFIVAAIVHPGAEHAGGGADHPLTARTKEFQRLSAL